MLLMDQDRTDLGFNELSEHLQSLIKPELEVGERLIWASEPTLRPLTSAPQMARALLVAALVCFALSVVSLGLARIFSLDRLAAWGILLAVLAIVVASIAGVCALAGSIFRVIGKKTRRRRIDALTDRRAIFWLPVAGSSAVEVRSIPRGSVQSHWVRRIQFPDGSGDVMFLTPAPYPNPTGFQGVADVRRVEELVRQYLLTDSTIAADPAHVPDPDFS